MKILLGTAALAALVLASAPAFAQHIHGGFRGGFHGGWYHGPRGGVVFGLGAPYIPYGAPYGYAYPYPPYGYGPPPPPPPEDDYVPPAPPRRSPWRVTQRRDETDFELPDSVLFALDSAKVTANADTVLKEIADAAHDRTGAHLVVEGHTDTSGSREHNAQLSRARAVAVAAVLARQGVDRARIQTEGLGENDLAVQTGDGVREAANRRVVVRLIGGAASAQR